MSAKSDPVKDDDAELEQLLERYAARLPLHANDTPDCAFIIDAKGENPALTTEPELILTINALPRLLAALRASREREERLRRALQPFANLAHAIDAVWMSDGDTDPGPIPDSEPLENALDALGDVLVTAGDLRKARAALKDNAR